MLRKMGSTKCFYGRILLPERPLKCTSSNMRVFFFQLKLKCFDYNWTSLDDK